MWTRYFLSCIRKLSTSTFGKVFRNCIISKTGFSQLCVFSKNIQIFSKTLSYRKLIKFSKSYYFENLQVSQTIDYFEISSFFRKPANFSQTLILDNLTSFAILIAITVQPVFRNHLKVSQSLSKFRNLKLC